MSTLHYFFNCTQISRNSAEVHSFAPMDDSSGRSFFREPESGPIEILATQDEEAEDTTRASRPAAASSHRHLH